MKTKMTITEISHEDLVNLLSTATYGSTWLTCCVANSIHDNPDFQLEESREDVWAAALLKGFPIFLTDHDAEGCAYHGRTNGVGINPDESATYRITLDDINAGLQSAMDGDFAPNDEELIAAAARYVLHLRDEAYDFDNTEAETLMQIIMFGTIVY